jgi:hypothetical protein
MGIAANLSAADDGTFLGARRRADCDHARPGYKPLIRSMPGLDPKEAVLGGRYDAACLVNIRSHSRLT